MVVAPETPKVNVTETDPGVMSGSVEHVEKKADLVAEAKDSGVEARATAERLGDVIQKAAALGVVTAVAADPADPLNVVVNVAQVNKLYSEITGVSLEVAAKLTTAEKLELLISNPKSAYKPDILNEEVDLLVKESHDHESGILH